jgi:hypothetical protein
MSEIAYYLMIVSLAADSLMLVYVGDPFLALMATASGLIMLTAKEKFIKSK